MTYSQIVSKTLKGSKNYPRDNPGSFNPVLNNKLFKVPLIEQFLEICAKSNKLCFIELKNDVSFSKDNPGI
ncbi:MAG: hypothetical protein K2M43_01655 [Mycoplasmoidaceae bacterium]|nr:hypothetical protein [Mycoplasmoidaceae bacterium]